MAAILLDFATGLPLPAAAEGVPSPGGGRAGGQSGAGAAEGRRAMLAKVHIALPRLYGQLGGFSEDVYRYVLRERWGVDSAGAMSLAQLDELLRYLAGLCAGGRLGLFGRRVAARRQGRLAVAVRWQGRLTDSDSSDTDSDSSDTDSDSIDTDSDSSDRDKSAAGRYPYLTGPLIAKINALLTEKGLKQGRFVGLEYAEGILTRQTSRLPGGAVKSLDQATPRQLAAVIAALDKDGKRKKSG
ncbi:MAG: hypothetical protein LBD82_07390 [Deltaproteobacteria bacterium]|jgi:hypothetical protein|nr:hypothetical protein [Deltaproteobacteria bacterium]